MTSPFLQLGDIQGNVLQGYGLRYAAYVNVRIADAGDGRRLLTELVGRVTSADPPDRDRRRSTLNLALSSTGLERLGVTPSVLRSFPEEFRMGMAERAGRLGDAGASAPECWQRGLRPGELQLLVIVNARSEEDRREALEWLEALVAARPGVCAGTPELGALGDGRSHTREHFGFADGFGQPAVAGQTGPEYRGQGVPVAGRRRLLRPRARDTWRLLEPGEFILGYRDEDGAPPPAPDPPFSRNATFMVFRKLRQDVVAFRRLLDELAETHYSGDRELAAAKLAGRWRDGTPLIPSPERPDPPLAADKWRMNDFRYAGDKDGLTCPLGAHVRRANPRDALSGGAERTRRHRIIRRGMPYGEPLPDGAAGGSGERGLLFACFNASIARQFEVVNGWLTRGDAFGLADGDVLSDRTGAPRMTIDGDPPVFFRPAAPVGPLITTRGGEYLFVPGLGALADLADGRTGG